MACRGSSRKPGPVYSNQEVQKAPQVTPMREIFFKPTIDLIESLPSSKPASNRSSTTTVSSKNERSFSTNYEFAAPTSRTSKGSVCLDDLPGPVMRTSRESRHEPEIEPFWLGQANALHKSQGKRQEGQISQRRGSHRRSAPAFFKMEAMAKRQTQAGADLIPPARKSSLKMIFL